MTKRLTVRALVRERDCGERVFTCSGQVARTLSMLVKAGSHGVTSLDIADTWALRTSHYIFVLRRGYGLSIRMEREAHDGPSGPGWHGRYFLETPVTIVEDGNAENARAA